MKRTKKRVAKQEPLYRLNFDNSILVVTEEQKIPKAKRSKKNA